MKKREQKVIKKNTAGDAAVKIGQQRGRDVLQQDSANKTLKPPKWLKPENHEAYMEMCLGCVRGDFNNISAFSRQYGISRYTIYEWLKKQDTRDLVDEIIKTLATADKGKVYQMVLSQVPVNATYARLWMERYEGYQADAPKSGNITINFNFLDPPKAVKQPAKEAEFEEIDEQ